MTLYNLPIYNLPLYTSWHLDKHVCLHLTYLVLHLGPCSPTCIPLIHLLFIINTIIIIFIFYHLSLSFPSCVSHIPLLSLILHCWRSPRLKNFIASDCSVIVVHMTIKPSWILRFPATITITVLYTDQLSVYRTSTSQCIMGVLVADTQHQNDSSEL